MGDTQAMPQVPSPVQDPTELRNWLNIAGQHIDRERVRFRVTAGAQSTMDRTITLQAIDRNAQAVAGRYVAVVYLATTATGAPGGTQTVVWGGGTVLATLLADQAYLVLTDADGTAEVTVTLGAPGSRWVGSSIGGDVGMSKEFAWV